jgi:O-antigen ligase
MTLASVVYYGLMGGAFLLFLLVTVVGIGLAAHFARDGAKNLFPWVLVAMGIGLIWTPIAGQRNLSSGALELMATVEEYGSALWLNRALTITVIAISGSCVLGWVLGRARKRAVGFPLYIALIAVLVTHNLVAGAFGTRPAFFHNSIYPILLFTAAYLTAERDYERVILFAKITLTVFLGVGLLAALIRPSIAFQANYSGLIPGLRYRYWGLGSHPNTVGPLAALCLMLVWHRPYGKKFIQWLVVSVALLSLILTQSKTAWAGGLLALATMAVARFYPVVSKEMQEGAPGIRSISVLMLLIGSSVAGIVVALFPDIGPNWSAIARSAANANMLDLTGRVTIWDYAFQDWERNPLFGYGPTWGDLKYRLSIRNLAAVHAHNQLVHSLAAAGLIGAVAAVSYFFVLGKYALRGFRDTQGLTVGLLVLLLARAVTEVPLSINNWGGAEVLMQLVIFVVMISATRPASSGG